MRPWLALSVTTLVLSLASVAPFPAAPKLTFLPNAGSYVIHPIGYSGQITVVAAPHAPTIDTLWVYDDSHYARGRGVDPPFAYGLSIHLRAELRKRGMRVNVQNVNAVELRKILTSDPSGAALIVTGGILPDTVRNTKIDLLRAWLAKGGVVLWEGEPFDMIFSHRAKGDALPTVSKPDPWKWPELYGALHVFNPRWDPWVQPYTSGYIPAAYSHAGVLELTATTYGPFADDVYHMGGAAIGYVDQHDRSTVSIIPFQAGTIIYFADGYNYEVLFARDAVQILWTEDWFRPRDVSSTQMVVSDGHDLPINREMGRDYFAFANNVNLQPLTSDAW